MEFEKRKLRTLFYGANSPSFCPAFFADTDNSICDFVTVFGVFPGSKFNCSLGNSYTKFATLKLEKPSRKFINLYKGFYTEHFAHFSNLYSRHLNPDTFEHTFTVTNPTFQLMSHHVYLLLTKPGIETVVFANLPHEGYDYLLYSMAKLLGIQTVLFFHSIFPGVSFCVEDLKDFGNFSDLPEFHHDALLEFPKEKEVPFYMNQKKPSILKEYAFNLLKCVLRPKNAGRYLYFNKLLQRQRKFAIEWRKHEAKSLNLDENFVYFPLHYQPELTTSAFGGIYCNQIYAIQCLSQMLPKGWKIYVKEHVVPSRRMRDEKTFFSVLKRDPNVVLVPNEVSSFELTEKSRFVATITGTVGYEALISGKNVLVFGNAWYKTLPGVTCFTADTTVSEILSKKIEYEQVNEAFQQILRKCVKASMYEHIIRHMETFDPQQNARETHKAINAMVRRFNSETKKTFTVVVPLKHAGSSFHATLQSLISQTEYDLHVLCVDDGASPATLETVRKCIDADHRFQLLPLNGNVFKTIRPHRRGRYLLFLEPGDTLEPNCCAEVKKQIQEDSHEIVVVKTKDEDEAFSRRVASFAKVPSIPQRAELLVRHPLRGCFISCAFLKKGLRRKTIRFRSGPAILGWSAMLSAAKVKVLREPLLVSKPSSTTTRTPGNLESAISETKTLRNLLESKRLLSKVADSYFHYKFNTLYDILRQESENGREDSVRKFCGRLSREEVRFLCDSRVLDPEIRFFFLEHLNLNSEQMKLQLIGAVRQSESRLSVALSQMGVIKDNLDYVTNEQTIKTVAGQQKTIVSLKMKNKSLQNELQKLDRHVSMIRHEARLSRLAIRTIKMPWVFSFRMAFGLAKRARRILSFLNPFSRLGRRGKKIEKSTSPVGNNDGKDMLLPIDGTNEKPRKKAA